MPSVLLKRGSAAVSINQIDRPKNLGLECLAFMYRKREKAEKEGWRMERSRARDSRPIVNMAGPLVRLLFRCVG